MINAIPSTTPSATGSSAPPTAPDATPKPSTKTALTSDFETFLKMLTAQAKNQDPLEPLDSTEYASQLAQFSMVEQQVQTNDSLAALSGLFGTSNMASLAGWVGMEARAATPMYFDGTPITLSPKPAALADEVYLVVSDASGKEVQRLQLPVSSEPVQWAGVGAGGVPLANGVYSFSVESYGQDKLILEEPAEVYGRITEAQIQGNEVVLVLEGGQTILSSKVTALRAAS